MRGTFVNHLGIFKVNRMIWRPSVFSAIRTSSERLHIPHVFFFSSFKAPASLAKRLNGNGFSVPNASKFVDEISNIDIQDDEIMLSFDVVSLFTAIPVKKACDYIQTKLDCDESLHLPTNLDTTDIISLLNFVLSNNYFVYNDSVYKRIHGYAMGSPVRPVVANQCMEAIEEMAINTTPVPPKVWKRYVDDSFCIIKRNTVDSFHNSLNGIDHHISFTSTKKTITRALSWTPWSLERIIL